MNDPLSIPRPEPLKQRIPSPRGGRRRSFFGGHARRKRRSSNNGPPEPVDMMPSIHEEDEGYGSGYGSGREYEGWSGPMGGMGGMGGRLPTMSYRSAGFDGATGGAASSRVQLRGRRRVLAAAACCALAALSCLSTAASASTALGAVGRRLGALGRLLSLASCDPSPYITPEQARELPPTPLPGAELARQQQDGRRTARTEKREYVPSHVAMCRELQRRHDLAHGDPDAEDPDAVAERFPPFVVKENENVCMSWEAPHFHLMEMLASTFLGVLGGRYNVKYEHDCARTRGEVHANRGGGGAVANQRDRNLQSYDAAHPAERAALEYDTTTIQQILPDVGLLLEHAKVGENAEREILALCRGCVQQHDALVESDAYDAPGGELDGVQRDVQDERAREYHLKMSHVSHECLLYPGGKSGEAAKAEGGNGVALSALRPIVVTLLRHAALDWSRRAQGPSDEGRHGTVVYLDDESSVMPAKVYADRIPQSVKTVTVLLGPLCGRRADCLERGRELASFLSGLYPSAVVDLKIVASTAAAFSRMTLAKHLIAPPGTVSALLPALAKPSGTFGTVGESDAFGGSTAGWFGGEDDGSKVGLAWCVTPQCRGEEDAKEVDPDQGSTVGLSWGLPGEEEDKGATVGMTWGLPGQEEDDPSKVGLAWGSNLETVEVSDEDEARAVEVGYQFTPEEAEELEEKWDRPVELKPAAPPEEEEEGRPQKVEGQPEPEGTGRGPEPDMSVSHAGTNPIANEYLGSPGKSSTVYSPGTQTIGGRPGAGPRPAGPTAVYQGYGHSGYTATHNAPVAGCTHTRGRLGQWQPDGTWKSAYPECSVNVLSLDGLCNVVSSLGLGRVMFVGDRLQGTMVQSMHKMLGLGHVDPNALHQGDGMWSKNVHCPRHGRSFELAWARNDRMATQTAVRAPNGPVQYLQAGNAANQCAVCAPWVQTYAASPVRTFLVACPCAACAHPDPGHRRGLLKGMFSGSGKNRQERELRPDDIEDDLERFLSLVRDVAKPDDAVFVRTAAPTYCKNSPRPDADEIDAFNDRVHDAVYEAEWGRTHQGPPRSTKAIESTEKDPKVQDPKQSKDAAKEAAQQGGKAYAPTYLLDVSTMTKSHPDSKADRGVDCEAGAEDHHRRAADYWNHMLYTSMIDLAKKEDPNFKVQP